MEKSYKYRIYPTKKQREIITKTFGCCRYVYNTYLAIRIEMYEENKKTFSYAQCSKDLKNLKSDLDWLREVDSTALQSSLRDLDNAYQKFFKNHFGFPKFKSKKSHRFSYRSNFSNGNIQYRQGYIKLPKVGLVKTRGGLIPEGRILSATVSQCPSDRYYVSLVCTDVEPVLVKKTDCSIGLDLGIKDFCIMSTGEKVSNLKYWGKSSNKLVKLQKSLSRKTKGGSNYEKTRIKLARLQEHIMNQRKDFLQKLSTGIIKNYDIICVEDLDIKGMIQKHKISSLIMDAAWSEFVRQLEYKAKWGGKQVIKIDRFYPSSQTCSKCGYINKDVKNLSVRSWECPNCHSHHDRDINAAVNILNEGLKLIKAI